MVVPIRPDEHAITGQGHAESELVTLRGVVGGEFGYLDPTSTNCFEDVGRTGIILPLCVPRHVLEP